MPEVLAFKLQQGETLTLALRPEQAADAIGVSTMHIYREISAGRIAAVKKGHGARQVVMITIKALMDYLSTSDPQVVTKRKRRGKAQKT